MIDRVPLRQTSMEEVLHPETAKKDPDSSAHVILESAAGRPGNDEDTIEVYKEKGKWFIIEKNYRELNPEDKIDSDLIEQARKKLNW
jgi:hypothetical protein